MKKIKSIIILILFVIIAVLSIKVNVAKNKLEIAKYKRDKISSDDTYLPPNTKSQIVVTDGKIVCRTRKTDQKAGVRDSRVSDSVVVKSDYLSPEGKAEINVDLDGHTTISIKSKGLCINPTLSAFYSNKCMSLGLGARLAYWNRYGITAGLSADTKAYTIKPFIAIERRISDLLPVVKNTTFGLSYNGSFGIYMGVFF